LKLLITIIPQLPIFCRILQPIRNHRSSHRHSAGCVERWQWSYAHSVAGGHTVSDSFVIDFDVGGKVCDHAFSTVRQ